VQDNSGFLDLDEFKDVLKHMKLALSNHQIAELFSVVDKVPSSDSTTAPILPLPPRSWTRRCTVTLLFIHCNQNDSPSSPVRQDGSGQIDPAEFEECLLLLKRKIAGHVLKSLGLTSAAMVLALAALMFGLSCVIVFFLFGIAAFSTNDSFQAVINSLLPIAAGGGAAATGGGFSKLKGRVQEFTLTIMEHIEDYQTH
jgi:hypothetical protein